MKILVDTPQGFQEVFEIGPGGGYFDPERVIWDERSDGPLPEITLGGMVRNGDVLEFDQERKDEHDAAILAQAQADALPRIQAFMEESHKARLQRRAASLAEKGKINKAVKTLTKLYGV